MKFNWGIFAYSLFGVFVIFILTMVYYATKQNNELVTENYYEKELEFKDILVKEENSKQLTDTISYTISANSFEIKFPAEITSPITGTIYFYKPSSEAADINQPLNISNNVQSFNLSTFKKGMYKVKIDWMANKVKYYHEFPIVIH